MYGIAFPVGCHILFSLRVKSQTRCSTMVSKPQGEATLSLITLTTTLRRAAHTPSIIALSNLLRTDLQSTAYRKRTRHVKILNFTVNLPSIVVFSMCFQPNFPRQKCRAIIRLETLVSPTVDGSFAVFPSFKNVELSVYLKNSANASTLSKLCPP